MTGLETALPPLAGHARLLQSLRNATSSRHRALDRRLGLIDPDVLTLDRYRRFVRATSAVVLPLEPPLAAELGYVFVARSAGERAVRLLQNLAALEAEPAPPAPDVPEITDDADAFGAAYVIQGSHLGGEIIARAVTGGLGLGPEHVSYLRLHDGKAGGAWFRFIAALEHFGLSATPSEQVRVVRAAEATFDAFAAALDREGIPRD
ncbi:MAG: biliverdin-producing heme oxygenase [Vicinamibacterales bacterium]